MAHHIRKRFSDQKYSIDQLMTKDSEFLSLCDDYDTCINALQYWTKYWTKSKEPEAESMIDEFRNIVRELEEEVIEALITQKTRSLKRSKL